MTIKQSCEAVRISRGCFYYQPKLNNDAEIKEQIEIAIDKRPRRGFGKIFDAIRRKGFKWNHKRVHRVYQENEFQLRNRKKQRIEAKTRKVMPITENLNEVWSIDFMSDSLFNGRKFRTFNVMDDFNREALVIEVDTSFPSDRVVQVLEAIASDRGYPKYIRSDNGPEFISRIFRKFCCSNRIRHRRIEPGKPSQNSYIERFNLSYREDILDMYEFKNLNEVRVLTENWQLEYNFERGHDALGKLTPVEYARSFFLPASANCEGQKKKTAQLLM